MATEGSKMAIKRSLIYNNSSCVKANYVYFDETS